MDFVHAQYVVVLGCRWTQAEQEKKKLRDREQMPGAKWGRHSLSFFLCACQGLVAFRVLTFPHVLSCFEKERCFT